MRGQTPPRCEPLGLVLEVASQEVTVAQVAVRLAGGGQLDHAYGLVDTAMDPRSAAEPMHEILCALARSGRADEALVRATAIGSPWRRLPQLLGMLEALEPEQQQFRRAAEAAVSCARESELGWQKVRCSLRLCGPRLAWMVPALAGSLAEDALSAALAVTDTERCWSLAETIRGLADAGFRLRRPGSGALRAAVTTGAGSLALARALADLARQSARLGHIDDAVSLAIKWDEVDRTWTDNPFKAISEYEYPVINDDWPHINPMSAVVEELIESGTSIKQRSSSLACPPRPRAPPHSKPLRTD